MHPKTIISTFLFLSGFSFASPLSPRTISDIGERTATAKSSIYSHPYTLIPTGSPSSLPPPTGKYTNSSGTITTPSPSSFSISYFPPTTPTSTTTTTDKDDTPNLGFIGGPEHSIPSPTSSPLTSSTPPPTTTAGPQSNFVQAALAELEGEDGGGLGTYADRFTQTTFWSCHTFYAKRAAATATQKDNVHCGWHMPIIAIAEGGAAPATGGNDGKWWEVLGRALGMVVGVVGFVVF